MVAAVETLLPGVGSVVAELTVTLLVSVVGTALGLTRATTVNTAVAPDANVSESLQVSVLRPTSGVQPHSTPGEIEETYVVFEGSVSLMLANAAPLGPLLVAVIV